MIRTQPSYSMGKKAVDPEAKLKSPGPGAYENADKCKNILSRAANYSFGTDERTSSNDRHKPNTGPGKYDPYKSSALDQLLGKMGKDVRKHETDKIKTPGPDHYTPQKMSKKAETWRIGTENRKGFALNPTVPGPGTYEPVNKTDSTKENHRIWTFGSETQRPRSLPRSLQMDGIAPNTYNWDKIKTKGHMAPFGKDVRRELKNISACNRTVAPGSYGIDTYNIDKNKDKNRGWSMGLKNKSFDTALKVPGPGAYETNKKISNMDRNIPSIVMGSEVRKEVGDLKYKNIGPGKYEPYQTSLQHTYGKIGKDDREEKIPKSKKSDIGPGQYLWDKAPKIKLPEYTFGKDVRKPIAGGPKFVPGPGRYEYDGFTQTSDHSKNPNYSIGQDLRKDEVQKKQHITNVPGPGKYDLRTKAGDNMPTFSVGKELRKDDAGKNKTPGPGKYEYRPAIPNVCNY